MFLLMTSFLTRKLLKNFSYSKKEKGIKVVVNQIFVIINSMSIHVNLIEILDFDWIPTFKIQFELILSRNIFFGDR